MTQQSFVKQTTARAIKLYERKLDEIKCGVRKSQVLNIDKSSNSFLEQPSTERPSHL